MSIKTKIAAAALAALTLGTAAVATSGSAEAHGWHGGWGWGGVGVGLAAGALIGAAAYGAYGGPAYAYGPGYRTCRWVPQYNAYGYFIGNARVCNFY